MKAIAFLSLLPFLSGCTTFGHPESKEPLVEVTVFREPSSRDSFFPMQLSVDGRPIAVLYPDEEHSFEVESGDRRLTYELGVYNCAADVRLEAGKNYVYRLAHGCVIEQDLDGENGTDGSP